MKNEYLKNVRTDLACECCPPDSVPDGCKFEKFEKKGFGTELLTVENATGERATGKPKGHYLTIHCGKIGELDDDSAERLSGLIADELRAMSKNLTKKEADKKFSVLAAGLGNAEMTPDAIGPGTISRLNVTRHIAEKLPDLFAQLDCCLVSALAPGVLGQTGVETSALLRGAADAVKPDLVVAVDAYAARSTERLAATVQISDTGINPGSGVGNRRNAVSRETLGVPVIAVGVPTVVDSTTLVADVLRQAGTAEREIDSVLNGAEVCFVTPKECDIVTKRVCTVLARAVDTAFGINP